MKNKFNIRLTLPSGKIVRIDELTNGQYLTLSKFCQNNDIEGLLNCFECILPLKQLNMLDKLYALISLYGTFINPSLSVKGSDNRDVSFDVSTILSNLDKVNIATHRSVSIDGWIYVLELPTDPIGDIYNCVTKICAGNLEVVDDVQEVIDNLSIASFSKLSTEVVKFVQPLQSMLLLEAVESFGIPEIRLNLISPDYFTFILTIFKGNLENIIESIFVFSQKFSSVNFFDMPLLDTRLMLNMLNKQIKEQNDALKSQQKGINP